jgi:hypothetical protein
LTFESRSKLIRIEALALSGCSSLKSICIPASVEIVCEKCFHACSLLSSLTFESGSKLKEIEAEAFFFCFSLPSLRIPPSVSRLTANWAKNSSLARVIFESAASLRTMIETFNVDLSGNFDIAILHWDCELVVPGYSVHVISTAGNFVFLVKGNLRA